MFPNPNAQSFTPSWNGGGLEFFAIYNDGVPGSIFYGNHPEHDVLQSITEEAIDDCFPPNAEEAAEIEAAEDFVETMAWLSFLDECDERARFNFEGMGKRWSARRAAGLIGKPNPAREIVATRTRSETLTNLSVTDLVAKDWKDARTCSKCEDESWYQWTHSAASKAKLRISNRRQLLAIFLVHSVIVMILSPRVARNF